MSDRLLIGVAARFEDYGDVSIEMIGRVSGRLGARKPVWAAPRRATIGIEPAVDGRRKANWTRLIQKVCKVGTLESPNCGGTIMHIISLIKDAEIT